MKINSPDDGGSFTNFTTILPSFEIFNESTVIGSRSMS